MSDIKDYYPALKFFHVASPHLIHTLTFLDVASIGFLQLSVTEANPLKDIALTSQGLLLYTAPPARAACIRWEPRDVDWRDVWSYERETEFHGNDALHEFSKLWGSYTPKPKARGERGAAKGRPERDFIGVAARVDSRSSGRGYLGKALDKAIADYPKAGPFNDEKANKKDALVQYLKREARREKKK